MDLPLEMDVLLSFQAKCVGFTGDNPPKSRDDVAKRMRKNVKKAIAQTKGSSRALRDRRMIYSKGERIDIAKQTRVICVIFIPSLDLILGALDTEFVELGELMSSYGQNLVVLDPMQLLRTIQAAVVASRETGGTIDECLFTLLEKDSARALVSGRYGVPALYR